MWQRSQHRVTNAHGVAAIENDALQSGECLRARSEPGCHSCPTHEGVVNQPLSLRLGIGLCLRSCSEQASIHDSIMNGTPMHGTPMHGTPMHGTPAPMHGTPAPMHGIPIRMASLDPQCA